MTTKENKDKNTENMNDINENQTQEHGVQDKDNVKEHKEEQKHESKTTEDGNKTNDFEEKYKRAMADYLNLKRRVEEEKREIIRFSNEVLLEKLLALYNDFDIAKSHIKDEGYKKMVDKFSDFLKAQGITEIYPLKEEFDPEKHEAIESVPGKANKVVKVHSKGYELNGKVIKSAYVAVGNGKRDKDNSQDKKAKVEA